MISLIFNSYFTNYFTNLSIFHLFRILVILYILSFIHNLHVLFVRCKMNITELQLILQNNFQMWTKFSIAVFINNNGKKYQNKKKQFFLDQFKTYCSRWLYATKPLFETYDAYDDSCWWIAYTSLFAAIIGYL